MSTEAKKVFISYSWKVQEKGCLQETHRLWCPNSAETSSSLFLLLPALTKPQKDVWTVSQIPVF